MKVIDTRIPDVKIIEPAVFGDERGFFLETFQAERYKTLVGIKHDFVQDNYSRSTKGVLRGLHFQKTKPQGKLVRVVRGEVFDVAVDLRVGSLTFGQWQSVILSEDNKRQFWVPPGFAHGFCVLSPHAHVIYKVSAPYSAQSEQTFRFDDPNVGIQWPLSAPIVSLRDQKALPLQDLKLRSF